MAATLANFPSANRISSKFAVEISTSKGRKISLAAALNTLLETLMDAKRILYNLFITTWLLIRLGAAN